MVELTNQEKFKFSKINVEKMCQDIQNEISMEELYVLKDDELNAIQNSIGDSIELEMDLEEPVENTRDSFYMKNGKVVVIKAKQLNVKRLFSLLGACEGFVNGTDLAKVRIVISVLMEFFCQVLDRDLSKVYVYLANEYFRNGRKFNNIEIIDAVNQYIKESMGVKWSDKKIQEKLDKLEHELRVIECVDGVYVIKDKINFA